jgi:hypothetical protein
MKRAAFDDPGAFRRRWSHLSHDQLRAESLRDPLLFAADHIPVEERREGTVVIVAELDGSPAPVVVVIPDGPPAPEEEACLGVLASVIAQLDAAVSEADPCGYDDYDDDDDRDPFDVDGRTSDGDSAVLRIGVVAHRLGSPAINDIDRRWMSALGLVSVALGIETIGVLSRTRGGAVVRVPEPAAA